MSKENIYYALGSLAYAIAKADGEIQKEELNIIRKNAQEILFSEDISNDFVDEIFDQLESKDISVQDAYNYAIDLLESNKYEYDFYDSVKKKCILFLESIAGSFEREALKERNIIADFKKAIEGY
jgi:hypothetical protein